MTTTKREGFMKLTGLWPGNIKEISGMAMAYSFIYINGPCPKNHDEMTTDYDNINTKQIQRNFISNSFPL